eukprot:6945573-Prorocentrum_lima.AAC.1
MAERVFGLLKPCLPRGTWPLPSQPPGTFAATVSWKMLCPTPALVSSCCGRRAACSRLPLLWA